MGIEIVSHIDLRTLDKAFGDLRKRGRQLRPVMRKMKPVLKKDQRANFNRREGPDGKWPPPSPATKARALRKATKRARKRGRKAPKRAPRRQLGKLRTAIRFESGRDYVLAESRVAWSGVHQHGGKAGRGATIPRRTFLWASEELQRVFREQVLKHVTKKWGSFSR